MNQVKRIIQAVIGVGILAVEVGVAVDLVQADLVDSEEDEAVVAGRQAVFKEDIHEKTGYYRISDTCICWCFNR